MLVIKQNIDNKPIMKRASFMCSQIDTFPLLISHQAMNKDSVMA